MTQWLFIMIAWAGLMDDGTVSFAFAHKIVNSEIECHKLEVEAVRFAKVKGRKPPFRTTCVEL